MYNSEVYNCQTNPNSSSIYIGIESEHQTKSHHTEVGIQSILLLGVILVPLGKDGNVCSRKLAWHKQW
jgi:hypothetical protein